MIHMARQLTTSNYDFEGGDMRNALFVTALLVTSVSGCSPEPIVSEPVSPPASATRRTPPSSAEPAPPTDVTPVPESSNSAERLKREAGEAWEAAEEFTAESRDQFVAEAKRRLALMDAKLEDWKRRAPAMSQEAREKWEPERIELQRRRDGLQRELDRLGTASVGAWADMKVGASKAWKEMSDAFRKAGSHFE